MNPKYASIRIDSTRAALIAKEHYQLEGKITPLPGELDFNFKIKSGMQSHLLKISRPQTDKQVIEFQQDILNFISLTNPTFNSPRPIPGVNGDFLIEVPDPGGNPRIARLLSWLPGRLWSSVNPQQEKLLFSLGKQAGMLTRILQSFDHPLAHRKFEWDIAQADWTFNYSHLFKGEKLRLIKSFQQKFKGIQEPYQSLRRSVVHNDVNDNNIIVTEDMIHPEVDAIIDYGDAIYTQTINDLAIAIAYAVMGKPDVLSASLPIIEGYHAQFPLKQKELVVLYVLVGMRLVISLTKSAINKKKEPGNKYLQISEKPAWNVLKKWEEMNEDLAQFSFREACGFIPHPNQAAFSQWTDKNSVSLKALFPDQIFDRIFPVDMSMKSTWLGHKAAYNDNRYLALKLDWLKLKNPGSLIAGGYLEARPFYCTQAFKKESNSGPAYRSVHLGTDFWLKACTQVHAPLKGIVISVFNNDHDKDYGPTIILKHAVNDELTFYSLYGHLTESSLFLVKTGQMVQKGDLIGYVGNSDENGNWVPHLHFQLILDLLGYEHDFPGVAFPEEVETWKSICPDPSLLFKELKLEYPALQSDSDLVSYRRSHLGKSLSLSYEQPIHMQRGEGVFLIDNKGRKYLDTVNNVAHVGHEHERVVRAGQEQMAILNTNSRYLHENINEFSKELLDTFPDDLAVVHFVNSGSEANELALRMARSLSGQKDMIAVEVGYHGNTSACIDISSYKFEGKGGQGTPEFTHIVPLPDAYRGLYQGGGTGTKYAEHIQEQINLVHSKGRKIAGFICESIISCGGQIELPKGYLNLAYEAVREAGGICIADEVQVGCGRLGKHFWGFQFHGVIPDIVTVGKPIGNGHPLAAVVCTRRVAEAFANGMEYFNTFGGNPVSCAIGREVLRVIKDEKLQQNAKEVGKYLKTELRSLQREFPVIGDVRGQGLFLGIELADSCKNPLTDKATYLANRMKELGILMSTDGKDHNVFKIKPPMVFSKTNADELIFRLKAVFAENFMRHPE